jgi:hypothetical protein
MDCYKRFSKRTVKSAKVTLLVRIANGWSCKALLSKYNLKSLFRAVFTLFAFLWRNFRDHVSTWSSLLLSIKRQSYHCGVFQPNAVNPLRSENSAVLYHTLKKVTSSKLVNFFSFFSATKHVVLNITSISSLSTLRCSTLWNRISSK